MRTGWCVVLAVLAAARAENQTMYEKNQTIYDEIQNRAELSQVSRGSSVGVCGWRTTGRFSADSDGDRRSAGHSRSCFCMSALGVLMRHCMVDLARYPKSVYFPGR